MLDDYQVLFSQDSQETVCKVNQGENMCFGWYNTSGDRKIEVWLMDINGE